MEISTQIECSKCGESKPLAAFPICKTAFGYENRCIECKKAYFKAYHAANKEKQLARMKAYRTENPEKRKAQRKKSADIDRISHRNWHRRNKDRVNAERREKYATDEMARLRKLAHNHSRDKRLKAGGKFDAEQWKALCDATGNVCLCCGEAEKLTIDHIVALSKGGSNDISNLQPLCLSCNSSKKTKGIDYRPAHLRAG